MFFKYAQWQSGNVNQTHSISALYPLEMRPPLFENVLNKMQKSVVLYKIDVYPFGK